MVNGVTYTKRNEAELRALVGTSNEGLLASSCTSGVTNMRALFQDRSSFNVDISTWDTSSVTDMAGMFWDATSFNQDISKWNTAAVTKMGAMFYIAESFNQDISNWNTAAVTDMGNMFYKAYVFNQDISKWNTGAVTHMNRMFYQANRFNQDIGQWNTAAVTIMEEMFRFAGSLTGKDLSRWDVGRVTRCKDFDLNSNQSSALRPNFTSCSVSGFYLDTNGVTVHCLGAAVGDTGVVNGVRYTRRNEAELRGLVGTPPSTRASWPARVRPA